MERSNKDSCAAQSIGPAGNFAKRWRGIGWGFAALVMALPAIAMQVTNDVDWEHDDFIVMALLLTCTGAGEEWLVRRSENIFYRAGSFMLVLTGLLTIWANLAVGMSGSEDNSLNLFFLGVPLIPAAGAAIGRFSARSTTMACVAAAATQTVLSAIGASNDPKGAFISSLFVLLWLFCAFVFCHACRASDTLG